MSKTMSNTLSHTFQNLRTDFWGTLAQLQDKRGIWLLIAGTALFLELFSWSVFQLLLGLKPCEMCVYIRFSMLAICVSALIAAIRPSNIILKVAGYILAAWWVVRGFLWNLHLHGENIKAADPDWISSCSDDAVSFPFGLPLDTLSPSHFKPQALCGQDSAWTLMGLSMPEWLFVVYGGFALFLLFMLASWLLRIRANRAL